MRRYFPAALILALAVALPIRGAAQQPAQAGAARTAATAEAAVGTAIVDREIQGAADSFAANVGTLYCQSRVANAADSEVQHVWFYNDEEVARVTLRIGGSPWRTHSSKQIPETATGNWRCEVRHNDQVIKSVAFRVQ